MADLANLVDYEHVHEEELRSPLDGKPLGIKVGVRSTGSAAANAVRLRQVDRDRARRLKGEVKTAEDEVEDQVELAASYIAWWDWGKHSWKGKKPELSDDLAKEVLREKAWFYAQVVGAADRLANFSPNWG